MTDGWNGVIFSGFSSGYSVVLGIFGVRGGVIGMWTTTTCVAGIVGFERYKGTLVHLILAPIGALWALTTLVASAAFFGVAALPLSWVTWAVLSWSVDFTPISASLVPRLLGGAVMLLVGCVVLSFVVAAVFVLTPNAISYEGLLLVPVFILSGIVFTSVDPPAWLALVSGLIPLRLPVDLLLGEPIGAVDALVWCSVVLAWLVLSGFLAVRALRGTTRAGTPEVTRSFTGWRPACAWAGRPPPLSPPSARR